eukprot:scaffold2413_cov171-Amphora_coffeaeformis.AAC.9
MKSFHDSNAQTNIPQIRLLHRQVTQVQRAHTPLTRFISLSQHPDVSVCQPPVREHHTTETLATKKRGATEHHRNNDNNQRTSRQTDAWLLCLLVLQSTFYCHNRIHLSIHRRTKRLVVSEYRLYNNNKQVC